MNAERLNAIAIAMAKDIDSTKVISYLQQMRDALESLATNPADTTAQEAVGGSRKRLEASLTKSASNDYDPAWQHQIAEIGATQFTAPELRTRIDEIFQRNQITTSIARDEIAQLVGDLEDFRAALDQIISGMEKLSIGREELAPGAFALSMVIPREVKRNNTLQGLGTEFGELRAIIAPFDEIATGSRPEARIRSIASSDFGITVEMAAQTAVLFALAVERIVNTYTRFRRMRETREALRSDGLDDEGLDVITNHVNLQIDGAINDITAEVVASAHSKVARGGRQNELTTEVRLAVRKITDRIDKGYEFQPTAGPPLEQPAQEGDEETEQPPDPQVEEVNRFRDEVASRSKTTRYVQLEGEPLLSLEDSSDQGSQYAAGGANEG